MVLKPGNVTFEQAAATPVAALTALTGLRDKGRIQRGQKLLINGAAGGVGTFAVQIGKWLGADVTGVCSTRNVELVRSIGADRVIDYTQEDFTKGGPRYDVVLDCVANHSLTACRRALRRNGICVVVTGPNGRWLGPLTRFIKALVLSPFASQKLVPLLSRPNKEDLALLSDLVSRGEVTPVIDKRFLLSELAEAIRYVEEGHVRGKVVIEVEDATGRSTADGT
jgi:NADPH:quinone reductase-like Zn-dependent oxidoreductase